MAVTTQKIVSYENLQSYDTLIKSYIAAADAVVDAKSIKTVLWDSTSEKIKFYKKKDATLSDTADYEVSVASSDVTALKTAVGTDESGNLISVASRIEALDAVVEQTAGTDGLALKVTEVDGKLTAVEGSIAANTYDPYGAASTAKSEVIGTSADDKTKDTIYGVKAYVDSLDGELADVAKSGAAADVSIADASDKITATTVEGALLEIVNKADANTTAISTLNGSDTTVGSVAKAIKDAIDGLDKEDTAVANQFVTAVSEENGVITVSRAALAADDIPDITLAKVTDAGTAASEDVATTEIAAESTDTSLVTAAQVAKFVKDQTADLTGVLHFRGIVDATSDVTDPKTGDVIVIKDSTKEYIYNGSVWQEMGDESAFVLKTTTIAGVDLQDNVTKAELLTALNVADGAQVNVLEGVQVNGTDLTADADKKVNVTVAEGVTNGTIAVNGTDIAVHGLGSAAYTESSAYDAAGTATTEIAKLDATVSTVTEANPTPVLNIQVTEEDGKLTGITASVKDETFDAYGSASSALSDAKDYADGLYEIAAAKDITDLFADESATE